MARLLYWMLLLLLTAFAANEARLGRHEEASGMAILAGLLAVLGPLYAYVLEPWNQRVSRDRLVEWIGENARDIRHGGAMREGVRVVPGTRLVRFEIVFSMVYFSRRTTTNLYLAGTPRAFFVGLAATAFTAIFGWWAVPWGIINTFRALTRNVRGADTTTVQEVLEAADAAPGGQA